MNVLLVLVLIGIELFTPTKNHLSEVLRASFASANLSEVWDSETVAMIYLYHLDTKAFEFYKESKLPLALKIRNNALSYIEWIKSQDFVDQFSDYTNLEEIYAEQNLHIAFIHLKMGKWDLAKHAIGNVLQSVYRNERPREYLIEYIEKPAKEMLSELESVDPSKKYELHGGFGFGDVPSIVEIRPGN